MRYALSGETRFAGARRVYNQCPASQAFNDASWSASNVTVTANTDSAPDGTLTADTINFTSAGTSQLLHGGTGNVPVGRVYVASFYAKAGTKTGLFVRLFGSLSGNGGANVTLTSVYQRFSVQVDTTAFTGVVDYGFDCQAAAGANAASQTTGTIIAWGFQIEDVTGNSNTNPSEYVSVGVLSAPYHGANVDGVKYFSTQNGNTVASNVVTEATGAAISSSVLLGYLAEGQRTNLCLQSQTFNTTWVATNVGTDATISPDTTVAPDGTTTGDSLVEDGATNQHYCQQSITFTAVAQTFSVYVKASTRTWCALQLNDGTNNFQAFFQLTGNGTVGTVTGTGATATVSVVGSGGWYRCTLTCTPLAAAGGLYIKGATADTVNSYAGSNGSTAIVLWGAQLEAASFASTYIPTTTASVTRNADVLTYPLAGNVAGLNGACYAEITIPNTISSVEQDLVVSTTGGAMLYKASTGQLSVFDGTGERKGNVLNATSSVLKTASRWDASSITTQTFQAGVAASVASYDGDLSPATAIGIGRSIASTELYGTVKNVRIYTSALTAAQLQAMTT